MLLLSTVANYLSAYLSTTRGVHTHTHTGSSYIMYISSRNSLIASAPAVQAVAAAAGEAVWAVGGVEIGQGEPSTLNP